VSNKLVQPTILDWDNLAPLATSPEDLKRLDAGEKKTWRIPVARRSSGETLAQQVHVARGVKPGPTLALIGSVHGDAIYGSMIVMEAFKRLNTHELSGTVIAVPVANPIAFESHTRTTGQGWNTDMNNMNRVFPGDAGGWVTQKLAHSLATFVLDQADASIDYHCGSDTSIDYILVNGDETPEKKRIYDYTRLMATDFVFVHEVDPFVGTIDQHMTKRGKLSIVAEQGGNVMQEGYLDLSIQRVRNFLCGLGMVDDVPVFPAKQLQMRERVLVRMDHGGIYIPEVGIEALSTVIPGDTVLGRIVNPHSFEVLQEVRAPYAESAILMMRPSLSHVNPGDYGFIISRADTGEWIDAPSDWRVQV
jgi:predicted deacylase